MGWKRAGGYVVVGPQDYTVISWVWFYSPSCLTIECLRQLCIIFVTWALRLPRNLLLDHVGLPQVVIVAVHMVFFLAGWIKGIILRHDLLGMGFNFYSIPSHNAQEFDKSQE